MKWLSCTTRRSHIIKMSMYLRQLGVLRTEVLMYPFSKCPMKTFEYVAAKCVPMLVPCIFNQYLHLNSSKMHVKVGSYSVIYVSAVCWCVDCDILCTTTVFSLLVDILVY